VADAEPMTEPENRTTTRRQAIGIAGATGVAFVFAGAPRGGLLEAGPAEAASATCVMTLGSGVRAGAARLTLKVADGSGNRKDYSRSLHVPKRR